MKIGVWVGVFLVGGLGVGLGAEQLHVQAAPPPGAGKAPAPAPSALPADLLWMIGPQDRRPARPPPVTPALRERGRALFRERCALCHGERGDGRGPLADRLTIAPTNFTAGVYKLRSTPPGALPTDEDLFGTLTRGLHGTPMQPWRELPAADRWSLVTHLKSLSPRFEREPRGRPVLVPIAPRETADMLEEGERIYVSLGCGRCHGDSGRGGGPAGEPQPGAGKARVEPRDFTRGRFLRGAGWRTSTSP